MMYERFILYKRKNPKLFNASGFNDELSTMKKQI